MQAAGYWVEECFVLDDFGASGRISTNIGNWVKGMASSAGDPTKGSSAGADSDPP
jgi:hypothetical protein